MRLLVDQDVWKITVDLLKYWGHDVLTAEEVGMARGRDEELLKEAKRDDRIFITRDNDFGYLVFFGHVDSAGVILLRMSPKKAEEVHAELDHLLKKHTQAELQKYFTTVEPKRHRMRPREFPSSIPSE
jgi:predicted nuclease of predicted toxin-antitoxin system